MKKIIFVFALAMTMVFAMGATVFASGNNMNFNPGVNTVEDFNGFTVTIAGGGNNAVLTVTDGTLTEIRNNAGGSQTININIGGVTLVVEISGNSIVGLSISGSTPTPTPTPAPIIVETYAIRQFVEYNQVDSSFVGTSEVEGSREFVNGVAVMHNWVRGNQNNAAFAAFRGQFTGQAVLTGASVTGTLNYQFVRNYVEQFERVYEWVDVTVWSDGDRDEVVREDSEHVYGDLVDGEAYYTGPYASSRAIAVTTTDRVLLHMGHGQSSQFGRTATAGGAFELSFELHNTGNPPRMTITIDGVNLAAL